jgi:hypothetical protein
MFLFHPAASPKFNLTPFEAPYLIVHVIGGQIGLPIIVLTAIFHKKIHLHPALVNFLTTWVRTALQMRLNDAGFNV